MTHRVAKTTLPRNGRGLADCNCQASAVNKHGSERIYWFSYRTVGLGWGELRVLDHRPASRNFSLAPNHQFTHCDFKSYIMHLQPRQSRPQPNPHILESAHSSTLVGLEMMCYKVWIKALLCQDIMNGCVAVFQGAC